MAWNKKHWQYIQDQISSMNTMLCCLLTITVEYQWNTYNAHGNGKMEAPQARKRLPGGTQRPQHGIASPKPGFIEVKLRVSGKTSNSLSKSEDW